MGEQEDFYLFEKSVTRGRPEGVILHGRAAPENLFENFALKHRGGRTNAKTFAALQENDLVRIFAGEIEFVGDDDYGVPILRGQAAQGFQQIHLRADIEVQGRARREARAEAAGTGREQE